jgi:hypothetical protein
MPPDYGVPEHMEGAVGWDWVDTRMREAQVYWIGTLHPAGRPHLMPNWGAWIDQYLAFGMSPETRKARNMAANPLVSIGVQDGGDAVILEGEVVWVTDREFVRRTDDEYERKYHNREGIDRFMVVVPHKVIALAGFPHAPTRWLFDAARG